MRSLGWRVGGDWKLETPKETDPTTLPVKRLVAVMAKVARSPPHNKELEISAD